ncbi:MAG TPA: hypothetical protein VGL05_33925 [Kribbella sp.]
MAVRRRLIERLRYVDRESSRSLLRRPGRTMRLVALSVLLCMIYGLTEATTWRDYATGASGVVLVGLIVVAPRGLYDGRWTCWAERHKRLSWLPTMVFLCVVGFPLISGFADDWKFELSVAIGVAGLVGVQAILRRRAANASEGPASGVDGGPSSP